MTAAPGEVAEAVSATKIAAVRSFIRGKRRRRWFDWYAIGFGIALAALMLSDFLSAPFSRLMASNNAAPAQAAAGAALVIAAAAGLIMLAQLLGPLALSPADASWLLLSPLRRRDVLRRPATAATAACALVGGLLGVLALAMAAPYLPHHGPRHALWAWLLAAVVGGAAIFVAAVLAAMLAQPWPHWRARLRAVCAVVSLAATLAALTGERWTAVPRHITDVFADISTTAMVQIMAVALALACVAALLVRRALPRFPADKLRSDSARAGTTRLAAAYLNVPLLTWIAEDSYWRGRELPARLWPRICTPQRLPARAASWAPAIALAWADWRRLARRPALLAAVAGSALAPALAEAALTGRARGVGVAVVLLCGAIAASVQGTADTRRDVNDPTLFRLLGVDPQQALVARAVLPALLSSCWLAVSLAILVLTTGLSGWLWPLIGLVAGPGIAAAALRIARTGPVDPAEQGPDTPVGPMPPWLITRAGSLVLGAAACYPLLKAIYTGHVHASTFAAQLAFSVIILGGYLLLVRDAKA